MKLAATLAATLGATMALGLAGAALAQADYPARPIKLVIPFPPGGGTDFVSRTVGSKLAEMNRWQVVLENQPGAGGNIAVANTAKAAPDGYTIVMGQSDNMMLGPWLYNNVGYDSVKSFAPIVQVSLAPLAIVANAAPGQGQPRIASTADMIARGKSQAGLSWATAGNGTVGHLFGEQFRRVAGIQLLQVPYKGATPGLADVMGGSVDVAIMSVPSVIGLVRGGKLTPVAVTTATRSPTLPDTPTLAEAGVRGVDSGVWLGLFAPAGTPAAVVQRLNAEINRVLQQQDVRDRITSGGAQPVGGTSEAFAAFVRTDYERWGRIAREANIKIE